MAREIQITPRRIIYAQDIELKLYKSLMKIASEKQEEITKIIQATLQHMRSNIEEVLEDVDYNGKEKRLLNLSSICICFHVRPRREWPSAIS